ncbi:hypothetical protein LCGC14_0235020 [marine sediment metagenome]|uniref:Uncharacterized protein n=1 Tax=marine sediment metagenome TaxID=412755 RepID=A0A0F9WTM5_9ZZZZ
MRSNVIRDPELDPEPGNESEPESKVEMDWWLRKTKKGYMEVWCREHNDPDVKWIVMTIGPGGVALANDIVDDIGIAKDDGDAIVSLGVDINYYG